MVEHTKKIGIVVAYHNFVNKFILPCLESILTHVHQDKLVCVFDNESNHVDNAQVAEFCQKHPGFLYVRVDNQMANGGLTGAWNRGINLCLQQHCQTIFVINDDILIDDSWRCLVDAVVDDGVIYGPVTNNPGHAWVDPKKRWSFRHLLFKRGKVQLSDAGQGENELPQRVGFVNGFCFGCTANTFVSNRYDEKHFFDPGFPFGGNESEFQLRLFNLQPASDKNRNKKTLSDLAAHHQAIVVPRCYVYHYKNHAWKKRDGGRHADEQFS